MKTDIINKAENFLKSYLNGKQCEYEAKHPWRKNSKFIVMHSLRVHSCALRILESENPRLPYNEKLILELAAVLHDIGKADVLECHAACSSKIVCKWLKDNPDIAEEVEDTERLLKIIEAHSDKDANEEDFCSAVLKDADTLDEIGALSIFMASNQVDKESPFFFNQLLERLETFEIDFCKRKLNKINTAYAKKLLKDRMEFIKDFNLQLSFEINGTEEFYRLSKGGN